jgi:hypothetical protein
VERPATCDLNSWKQISQKTYEQRALSGAGRSERSGEATNSFQKRLPAGDFILLLFFTTDIEQLNGAVYSRKALR